MFRQEICPFHEKIILLGDVNVMEENTVMTMDEQMEGKKIKRKVHASYLLLIRRMQDRIPPLSL